MKNILTIVAIFISIYTTAQSRKVLVLSKDTSTSPVGTGNGSITIGTANTFAIYGVVGKTLQGATLGSGVKVVNATVFTDVAVLPTIAAFSTFSGQSTTIQVSEEYRGGIFHIYVGAEVADNGMIFLDALERKWKRTVPDNRRLNIRWYGAKSTTTGTNNDILAMLNTARDYIFRNRNEFEFLFLPRDSTGLAGYFVSNTFFVKSNLRMIGEGTTSFQNPIQTQLRFPQNTVGIDAHFTFGMDSYRFELSNFKLFGQWDNTITTNITKHGYYGNIPVLFKNVDFWRFSGDGIHIDGCADPNIQIYGNADASQFDNIHADFCTNGMYFNGCDVNSVLTTNSAFNNNRRWGVYDNGFLGNMYVNNQFTANGAQVESNVAVSYNGRVYAAINNDSVPPNLNKIPSSNPSYWVEVFGGLQTTGAWLSTKTYVSGGSLFIVDNNAKATVLGNYVEGYQPESRINIASLSINPNLAPIGSYITSDARGIVMSSVVPGTAVNVTRVPFSVNNTNNDMDNVGNLNIADTTYPELIIGGTPAAGTGTYNNYAAIRFRGKKPTDAQILSYAIIYDNDFRKSMRFVAQPADNQIATLELRYNKEVLASSLAGNGTLPITANFEGKLERIKVYTVATLPTGFLGMEAVVTDATSPTYLGILLGGGNVKCPVFHNGTNWVSH